MKPSSPSSPAFPPSSTGSSETCAGASSSSSSSSHAATVSAVTDPPRYRRKPTSSRPTCPCRSEAASGCSSCSSPSSLQPSHPPPPTEHSETTRPPNQQAQSSHNDQDQDQQDQQDLSHLSALSQHLVTAARHHVALGALYYQRCSYRAATEHYQRSIAFLMRREDALTRYGATPMAKTKTRLAVEIEKMEFYTHVLCLNNSSDMDLLQRQQQGQQGSHKLSLFKYNLPIAKRDTTRKRRLLPPRRLTFYLDGHGASYALDGRMEAHQVLPPSSFSVSSSTSSQQSQSQTQTLHLLKAYVMYNLALCHVALGSYAESLNLLRMVLDDDDDGPYVQHQHPHRGHYRRGGGGIPIDLVKVIEEYQAFVRQVLRVQRAASSSNAAAASTSTSAAEEGAERMDVDAAEAEADGIDVEATATTDEDGPSLPASAA